MTTPAIHVKDANVSVGCPRSSFQIQIHDFAKLTATKNHFVSSPEFTCNGHQWEILIFPGGCSLAADGKLSAYLRLISQGTIKVRFGMKLIDNIGKASKDLSTKNEFTATSKPRGWPNFISRSKILDESKNILSNGALRVVVFIEEEPTTVFVPKNPLVKMMQTMFNDENTADVYFEVSTVGEKKDDNDDDDRTKRAKTTTPFYAHHNILRGCAPMLADICGSTNESGGVVTASVNDVKPEIFHHLLSYVYGIAIPEEELKAHAKDIIDAADKYSIVNLKLAAEAAYVQSTKITFDNVMDDLLYADSRNCALLKEAAMDFLAENSVEATEKVSFANFPGHLSKDIFVAVNKAQGKSGGDDALAAMSVSELRKKLDEKGLDVDGSREAMIESIKSHS